MTAPKPNRNALVALDGPSALALYRDRDAAEDLQNNPDELELSSDVDDVGFWLSDEDIAAIMDEPSVFVWPSDDADYGRSSSAARNAGAGEEQISGPGEPLPALDRTRSQSFRSCTSHSQDLKHIPFEELGIPRPSRESPLHIIVSQGKSRRAVVGVHVRTLSKNAPHGALRKLGEHILVPTPEFTFLLLARYLDLYSLIRVGMELCGHYRLVGTSTTNLLANRGTLYGQRALTNVGKLRAFVESASGFPGSKRALRACKFIEDNSASPMETVLYLLLCLPRSMGGYGLPRPTLNAKRTVTGRAEALTFSHCLVPDLYWASAKLDMEYDSEKFHSNPASLRNGARRTLALRAMNVEVLSMTSDIVRDAEAFDAAAHLVARSLHVRLRPMTSQMREARESLRHTLLFYAGA